MPSARLGACPHRDQRQSGVGLIELMMALVIGLLVSMAAIGSLSHARLSSASVGESARLHQDASTALRTIEHHVRQAGGHGLRNVNEGGDVEFNPDTAADDPAHEPRVVDGTQGGRDKPDTLRVAQDTDASIDARDCLGNEPVGERIQNAFELVAGNLRCKGSGHQDPAPLIEAVEDFQVRYAVRQGDRLQYQDAPADWSLVQGVMVCLRLVGQARGSMGAGLKGCRGETVADDGRMRRVFVRVIHIRSAAP